MGVIVQKFVLQKDEDIGIISQLNNFHCDLFVKWTGRESLCLSQKLHICLLLYHSVCDSPTFELH